MFSYIYINTFSVIVHIIHCIKRVLHFQTTLISLYYYYLKSYRIYVYVERFI